MFNNDDSIYNFWFKGLSASLKDEKFTSKCRELTYYAEILSSKPWERCRGLYSYPLSLFIASIDQLKTTFEPIFSARDEINSTISDIEMKNKYRHVFDLPEHLNKLLFSVSPLS